MEKMKISFNAILIMLVLSISGVKVSHAQLTIPNIQGTWAASATLKDINWTGEKENVREKVTLYIYQNLYVPNEPNLTIVTPDDPEDPFLGFVQGNSFSFYKNNKHGDKFGTPNVGREIIIGTVSKNGKSLTGSAIGFDSNPDWGSTWSYTFTAKKVSSSVP